MTLSAFKQSALMRPKVWAGLVFLLTVLGLGWWSANRIRHWLEDEQHLPVQHIVIAGKHRYIDDNMVRAAIRKAQPGSFFELDVNKALAAVEAMPWVHKASVRKEWPSTLKVFLVEQVPVAHWNTDSLIDQQGELFSAVLQGEKPPLPQLYGPGGSEQTALQGYRAMQELLDSSHLQIDELSLSERFAWQIRLTNGIRLNIGREQFIDRVQRFVDLYPLLLKNDKQVDYVDLRYDTGLAVGWKQASESN